jgi:pimeloyl-ACP methyl ester carboxylesterase
VIKKFIKRHKRGALLTVSILIIITGCFLWYKLSFREIYTLTPALRAQKGGSYISLPSGITHFELTGKKNNPAIVMVHGSTVSIWDFDFQVKPFVQAGFKVLRYDALGRGLTDRPLVPYTRELYRHQLEQLVDKLNIKKPFILLGHSLGGATAAAFAAVHPSWVLKLVLIDPVIDRVNSRAPFIVCNMPYIGKFVQRTLMMPFVRKRALDQWKKSRADLDYFDNLFKQQSSIKGFEFSVCSMFKTDLVGNYKNIYKTVGKNKTETLLLWGTEDHIIKESDIDFAAKSIPGIKLVKLIGLGHSPHAEKADEINRIIIDFLKSEI